MNLDWLNRTELLIGKKNLEKLRGMKVVVVGLGGVGGSCAEALCRAGIGNLMIVDGDKVEKTNINRQIIATHDNIGSSKAKEMYLRLKSINPTINLDTRDLFCLPGNSDFIFNYSPNYIVDAIDTVTMKIFLIEKAIKGNINIVSSMGMGNRFNPSFIKLGTLEDTKGSGCVLSRIIRSKLKKINIFDLNVVYSLEKPKKVVIDTSELPELNQNRHPPGSFSCVPPVAGYFLAYKVVNDLIFS